MSEPNTEREPISRISKRVWAIILALGVLVGIITGVILHDRTPDELEPEIVELGGSRYISYIIGATSYPDILSWAGAFPQATPAPRRTYDPLYPGNYPIGMICLTQNLNEVWPSSDPADIAWTTVSGGGYDGCFANTATFTITLGSGQVISQPVILDFPPDFYAPGGSGTSGSPYGTLYLPGWMASDTYVQKFTSTVSGKYYYGLHYDNMSTVIPTLIAAAGARYTATPEIWDRIAAIRLRVGSLGEPYPIFPMDVDAASYANIQKLYTQHQNAFATCDEYKQWINILASSAAAAFPNKPILIMSSGDVCASYGGVAFRATRLNQSVATGTPIGITQNLFTSHRADASAPTAYPYREYKNFSVIAKANALSLPGMAEFAQNPSGSYANDAGSNYDNFREWYWTLMQGFGSDADIINFGIGWRSYFSTWGMWIADCLSNARCGAIFFRDIEDPYYTYNINTSGYADSIGDLGRNLMLQTPTAYPQGCRINLATAAAVRVAAVTPYVYTPFPCNGTVLPTPAGTRQTTPTPNAIGDVDMLQRLADRQARYISASSVMTVAIESSWSYYDDLYEDSTLRIIYLDSHADNFTVYWPDTVASVASEEINRTGSGIWVSHDITTDIYASGNITVSNTSANQKVWLHMIGVVLSDDSPTATPTSTPVTPSPTPSRTPTSTSSPTATPVTGTIRGTAFTDTDRNGTLDGGESGIADSGVYLTQGEELIDSTTTDVSGVYTFTTIALGLYSVTSDTPVGYELTTSDGNPATANVTSSDVITINFGFALPLTPTSTPQTPSPTPTMTPTSTSTSTRTATPTSTSTSTSTPTSAPTSTPTQSPVPLGTMTPTSTPAWTPISCPTMAVTVDGTLTEWAAKTPVALSAGNAAYIEVAATVTATPVAANIDSLFYCGWSGSTLYFAGIITDTVVLEPSGSYRNGDSALVALDGKGDGFSRLRADDHDLYIPAPGDGELSSATVLDYDLYPLGVTTVISDTADGWYFEMSVPNAIHQAGSLTTSMFIGVQYGLYDRDGGTRATYQIMSARRRGDLD